MGSEAALDAAAARLQSAFTDHGCRGTPACEGLSGATKVAAVSAPTLAPCCISPALAPAIKGRLGTAYDCMQTELACPFKSSVGQLLLMLALLICNSAFIDMTVLSDLSQERGCRTLLVRGAPLLAQVKLREGLSSTTAVWLSMLSHK